MIAIFGKRHRFDLLVQFIKTNFKMRYQNSFLGILWVIIKPYTTFVIMFFIWSNFGGKTIPNYSIYLLVGVIFYTYFNEMVLYGQMALLDRTNIILKISFPRQIAIVSALVSGLINLMLNMILVFVITYSRGITISIGGFLYLILLTALVFNFVLGLSFFTSIITVRFRDLKNVFELGLFVLMWGTPIFYTVSPLTLKSSLFVKLVSYNPIGVVINQVRAAFGVYGKVNLPQILLYFLISTVITILGWRYFNKKVKKIAEYF